MADRYPEDASKCVEQLVLDQEKEREGEVPVIPRYDQFGYLVAVGKRGHNPGELYYPHGVAIDEAFNHIYVTEGGFGYGRVSIFSENGEFLSSSTNEHMRKPWGIAFNRNNVYVTDVEVHAVFHLKLEADIHLVAKLMCRGSSYGKFSSPRQLAVSDNGDLFIPDSDTHTIQILDKHLHFKRAITHDSMHSPRDIKLTPDEVYVLTDEYSLCVHVFSHAGNKLRSIIRCTEMHLTVAWFFCLDAEKNLIVSDGWDHSIKVFSPDGTLLHTIREFRDTFWGNPLGLALMKLKLVVVTPLDEFKLKIYSD